MSTSSKSAAVAAILFAVAAHAEGISGGAGRDGLNATVGEGISGGGSIVPAWVLTTAGGTPASIDMDFVNNRYYGCANFAACLNFSRASTATYTDASGNLTTVASNVPAIGTAGLQLYPAATNVLLNSGDLSNASWTTTQSGAGTVSVTGNNGVAPDGTTTAAYVTFNRTTVATDVATIQQAFTGTAVAWVGSFYVKAGTAGDVGKVLTLNSFNGTANVAQTTVTLTNTWQRVAQSATMAASVACYFSLGYTATFGTQTGAVNAYIWGGQAQATTNTTNVTPYIPTTTASASSAIDYPTLTGAAKSVLYTNTYTLVFKFAAQSITNLTYVFGMNSGAANGIRLPTAAIARAYAYGGGNYNNVSFGSGTLTSGSFKVVLGNSYSAGTSTIAANNSTPAVVTGNQPYTQQWTSQTPVLGGNGSTGPGGMLSSNILRFTMFNVQIPNTDIQNFSNLANAP